jgi:hypothetical protein
VLQERFVADDSKERILIWGRRTGKTDVLIVAAVVAMLLYAHEPGVYVVYISTTGKEARKQFWKPLKRLLDDYGYAYKADDTTMALTLEGGGNIMVGGADNMGQVRKYRGFSLGLAIVDECGTYPSLLLKELIEDVLEPGTADVGGRLVFAGTPGPTPTGTWYEMSGPAANGAIYRGDMRSNPHMRRDLPPEERAAAVIDLMADIRAKRGWSETHPTYVREYLGLWAQDDEALVFPLSANANDYQGGGSGPWGLPSHTDSGVLLTVSDWRVVIGVDVGFTSASAFVVVATHPSLARSFILRAHKQRGQHIPEMARELRVLRESFAVIRGGNQVLPTVVIDSGGMGKIHASTLSMRLGIPVTAANKTEKGTSIALTRDDLASGRIQLLRRDPWGDDPCAELVDEWHVLSWNKDRDGIADGQEDHATDAALYGLRELRDYTRQEAPTRPKKGTPEWHAEKETKMLERLEREHQTKTRSRRSRKVS